MKLWKNKLVALLFVIVFVITLMLDKNLAGVVGFICVPLAIILFVSKENFIF